MVTFRWGVRSGSSGTLTAGSDGTSGSWHFLSKPNSSPQTGHNAAQFKLNILFSSLYPGKLSLKGIYSSIWSAQPQFQFSSLCVGVLQINFQVTALILQLSLSPAAVFQCHLVVFLFQSRFVNQFTHLALKIGKFFTNSFTASFSLNHLINANKNCTFVKQPYMFHAHNQIKMEKKHHAKLKAKEIFSTINYQSVSKWIKN